LGILKSASGRATPGIGSVEAMTEAPALPPLHMRRNAFDPTDELGRIRGSAGVHKFVNPFGMQSYLVTRHDDIKSVLGNHERFSNSRPPGFAGPMAAAMDNDEQNRLRAGNLLGLHPPEHQRLRRMLTWKFTVRRMTQLQPRIVEIVERHLDAMESAPTSRSRLPSGWCYSARGRST
jgi:cytochrome P450